jgi:hypothetical protein
LLQIYFQTPAAAIFSTADLSQVGSCLRNVGGDVFGRPN